MPLQPNQLIGPYVLIRQLGRGTFGEVWLARHHDLNEERALKIPTDSKYVQQLRREGKLIYSLQHENIVRGFDLNTLNDPPYVAMEYIHGVTLRQKLQASGKLPTQEALAILRQILWALVHAHEHGVLHRDLKPENVLLTASGQVKVTDFGLGKVQADVAQSIIMSGSLASNDGRSLSGTIEYMSPQQKAGEEPDVRDDIYAVGIIACELLTGSRPDALGIARMLQRAGADARLLPVLEKALEPERGERYGNVAEMLHGLEAMTSASPTPPATSARAPSQSPASSLGRGKLTGPSTNSIGMQFVRIEPGEFLMGSPVNEEGRADDERQHMVRTTRPFMMAVHPVTQAQWRAVMGNSPSYFKGDDRPVEQVSWDDAVEFCGRLSQKEGRRYGLPTEAEWEYACRAGTTGPYAGSWNLDEMGWFFSNSGGETHPVGQKKANAWGLYDMHGKLYKRILHPALKSARNVNETDFTRCQGGNPV